MEKLSKKYSVNEFSIADLAVYFEKFDKTVCIIETPNGPYRINIKKSAFPHMIGIQHVFKGQKKAKKYSGNKGFELLKTGAVTYDLLKSEITKNEKCTIAWKNIEERITYIPVFFNFISERSKFVTFEKRVSCRRTEMDLDFILYKNFYNNKYPCLGIKKINEFSNIIRTFFVEKDTSLLVLQNEVVCEKIYIS